MEIAGQQLIEGAGREEVLRALADPAVLARTLPGCRELVPNGNGYVLKLEAGVGTIRGVYEGRLEILEQTEEAFAARVSARGGPGSVVADVRASLAQQDGGTLLDYTMSADVTGAIAAVGQRVLGGVSRKNAAEFFERLDAELQGEPAVEPSAAAAEQAPGSAQAPPGVPGGTPTPGSAHAGSAAVSGTDGRATWLLAGIGIGAALVALGVGIGRRS
jgi:carbon monoxide dehydrogenase subunit G